MKIRTNKIFDNRFGKTFQTSESPPSPLLQIVDSGFISEDGAWFVASLRRGCSNLNKKLFSTPTEIECFVNHIHIDDFCEQDFLGQAFYSDTSLRKRLGEQLGEDKMRSIISLDDAGCVFRCHVIRAGERWNVDDLDSYKQEAMLVIDP